MIDNKINTFSEYLEYKKTQETIPGENLSPTIFNDVLSNDELAYLQNLFNNYPEDKIDVQGFSGLGTLYIDKILNQESIIKRVELLASQAFGEELEVLDFSGTRYSPKFGWEVKLGPHYDARPVEMFVFDIQIQSNTPWGLFFEGKRFDLKDNQALLFSGTSQIHWRDPIRLDDDAQIDLIFFWMQHKKPKPLSEKHISIMRERQSILLNTINILPGLSNSDWWKPIKRSDSINKYPHYEKISITNIKPLEHNEIYRSAIEGVDYSNIYKHINLELSDMSEVNIPENIKNKIINQMTHIHAEYNISFKNINFVRYRKNNLNNKVNIHKNNKNILAIAIKLNSSTAFPISINNKLFYIDDFKSFTLSPTNQTVEIKTENFKDNDFVDVLFCNFYLNSKK